MREAIADLVAVVTATAGVVLAIWAAGHAVLYKRDPRAALGWMGLIWFAPLLGPLLYWGFGINRIRRKARTLRPRGESGAPSESWQHFAPESVAKHTGKAYLVPLAQLVGRVVGDPLLAGNRVQLLPHGDSAFPAMLGAIDAAEQSISLSTYIFDNDAAGQVVADALVRAVQRGVAVRVLIDAVGSRYSRPPMLRLLRRAGVPVQAFMPTLIPWRFAYLNLRSHRKLLIVDGRVGFTGGMNIRVGSWLAQRPRSPFRDVHAKLLGPIVGQLQAVFAQDWHFTTGEELDGPVWFPSLASAGSVPARAIPDGPDEDFEELRNTLLGALAVAQERVRIVTPYFLPDQGLITALNVAALRGVQVDIVLPAVCNLRLVQWATRAILWQLLEPGCRVWLSPPPFDHAKLMVVDGAWCLLGSANWDSRSLRLNFELNVECYDVELAETMESLVEQRIESARPLTLEEVDGRRLPIRLRDGVTRLLSPYL